MPGQASTVGSKIALDALTGRATQTARTMYAALLTALPGDGTTMATMAEVFTPGSNGYARQAVAWTDPSATEATSNSGALTYGPFSADPSSVNWIALVSTPTGTAGELVFWWVTDAAKDAGSGDTVTIAIGALGMGAE